MTYRLACELGFRIAAVASVGGPLTDSVLYFCDSSPFKSILHIHGTADSTIPYSGVGYYPSVDSTVQYFVNKNNCPPQAVTQLPDLNNTDSSTVTKSYYGPCQNSTEVILYTVNNGGHTWPGASIPIPNLGNTNQDIKASGEIWDFFRRHLLDTNTVSAGNEADLRSTGNSFSCYPNPTEGALNIRIPGSKKSYTIMVYNIMGQVVERGGLNPSADVFMQTAMNLNLLPKGIYLVRVIGDEHELSSIIVKE